MSPGSEEEFWIGGDADGTDLQLLTCSAAFGEGAYDVPIYSPSSWKCAPESEPTYTVEFTDTYSGNISVDLYDDGGWVDTRYYFVILDTDHPTSTATPPALSNGEIQVPWYGVDHNTEGDPSGVQRACLYYKQDGDVDWSPGPCQDGSSGIVGFTPSGGDGEYFFQTIAFDNVGNMEPPGSGDGSTVYDSTVLSSADAPTLSNENTIPITFTVEPDVSGLDYVRLHYRLDGAQWVTSSYFSPLMTGTFDFHPTDGDGSYDFQTIAVDNLGNVEAGPSTPDATTLYDTTPPTAQVDTPDRASSLSWLVSWSGQDSNGGSGVVQFDVQYQINGGDWNYWITGTTELSQVFGPLSPVEVENTYTYTLQARAYDQAGNQGVWGPADETVVDVRYVYLPLVLKADPNPYEENDTWSQAYGPLISGKTYSAFPEDQYDYYYFDLASQANVTVNVENFLPLSNNGTVALYREDHSRIDYFGYLNFEDMVLGPHTLDAGKYYVLVYTAPDHYTRDGLYLLRVTW